ncbi:MAG: TlpA family protein disulfide reductase [Bacteroidetes bacterium]|nr:TlpA family protein disulfide reductase [Bacteroidota bacterium]
MRRLLLPLALVLSVLAGPGAAAQQRINGVHPGEQAPEIAMEDPDGDTLRLSQLHGKVVLVDFWASWCKPCRLENPHVRKAYRTYKDQAFTGADGFAVFSVSLDRAGGLAAWKKAIAADSLDWHWHVGAVKDGRNAAADRYQVSFIPTNVLIDGTGKIVATDLHGDALEQALDALLEKDPVVLAAMKKKREAEAKAAAKAARKARKKAK